MENPDTVIELDRSEVEKMFADRIPPMALPPRPFAISVIEGHAELNIAVSRVWFHFDGNGRRWRDRDGTTTADLDRHLAFDLRLGDHPPVANLPDSKLVFTGVLGLPPPSGQTATCNGREIRFNEIPLFGRLVIHDTVERVRTSTADGQLQDDVVIDFTPRTGHSLEAEPSSASQMFGPAVQQQADGRVVLTGPEPHVVWELTPSEQQCIRNTVVGRILDVANVDVIDLVAEQLASGVVETLATLGDNDTPKASLLPAPRDVDPTGESGDTIQVDGIVRLWTRESAPAQLQESLQIQIQTVFGLTEALPPSVLAFSTTETVGMMQAGFAILRSIRKSQIASLCLKPSNFKDGEGCELGPAVAINLDGQGGTLERFSATIEESPELGHDVLKIEGAAGGDNTFYNWAIAFGLVFQLDRGGVPRDPLAGEVVIPTPTRTLAQMNARLRELTRELCDDGDRNAIAEEQAGIDAEKKALPTEIGVKPQLFGTPFAESEANLTILGALLFVVLGILSFTPFVLASAAILGAEITGAVIIGAFIAGYVGGILLGARYDDLALDSRVSDALTNFIDRKKDQEGTSLPLEGYSPTVILLKDRVLRVLMEPLPEKLRVTFFQPDEPSPLGDSNFVAEQVAGQLADGRLWRLTVADAAHLITKGRIAMSLETVDGREFPLHVAHSNRGRRFLRTPHDDDVTNNLASLPRIPTV